MRQRITLTDDDGWTAEANVQVARAEGVKPGEYELVPVGESLADDPAAVERAAQQIYLEANASDGEVAWADSMYQDDWHRAAERVLRAAETQ